MKILPMRNKVLVQKFLRGERVIGGIVVPNDDGKDSGIRPRWAQIYAVGEEITDLKAGEWILVEHGRWTRSMTLRDENDVEIELWVVDYPDGVLAVSDEQPSDETFSNV